MEGIALEMLSFLTLSLITVFSFVFAKKIKFPYTLFLVLVGTVLAFAAKIPTLEFIGAFKLSPDMLFYIFLPTLLFEAGYNIKFSRFIESIKSIFSLAIIGLIVSTVIIGFLLTGILAIFGIEIPLVVALLFGAIISATDPVAVIALFKEYSAPKRLTLIFEGESLFNDGTAVAMFVVILSVIAEKNGILDSASIISGIGIFASMIILGFIFGIIFGGIFSKMLDYVKNENLQITLSLLVAHFTFLISEMVNEHLDIPVSAIVATVTASIIVGNYGRYKLTPRVERYIDNFWEYFAFIANSIVFLLLGFLLTEINFSSPVILLPIFVAILVTMFARAVSVYFSSWLLKFQKKEKQIPKAWQHLLSWGSLRGALAIMMVLLIPDDLSLDYWNYPLSIKEFVMALVIGSIYFTLFVKGLTIGKFIKKLKLSKVGTYEKMEYLEGKSVLYQHLKKALKEEFKNGDLKKDDYEKRVERVAKKSQEAREKIARYSEKHKNFLKRSMSHYVIGVERQLLDQIYSQKEITEKGYKKFLNKLDSQEIMLSDKHGEIKSFDSIINNHIIDKILEKMDLFFRGEKDFFDNKDKYFYYKALADTSKKVVEELKKISTKDGAIDRSEEILSLIKKYNNFKIRSITKLEKLLKEDESLKKQGKKYVENKIISLESEVLEEILDKKLISKKIKILLEKEIKEEMKKEFE